MSPQRTHSILLVTVAILALAAGSALADGLADRRSDQQEFQGTREAVYKVLHMEPTAAGRPSMDNDDLSLEERDAIRQQLHDRQDTNSAYQIKRAVFGGGGNQ